jgi:hypothetical protein
MAHSIIFLKVNLSIHLALAISLCGACRYHQCLNRAVGAVGTTRSIAIAVESTEF